jgi:hypothetical protein
LVQDSGDVAVQDFLTLKTQEVAMTVTRRIIPVFGLAVAVACSESTRPLLESEAFLVNNAVESLVTGSYTANVGATVPAIASYELNAKTLLDGRPAGEFTFFVALATGTVDFAGRLTCLSVDDALGRAWIGAVITRNSSTHPSFNGTNVIHQVGHDVWFRVADRSPGGSGDADRTTTLGFEGAGGIPTSAEYCATRPWANDGIAIQSGNVSVH